MGKPSAGNSPSTCIDAQWTLCYSGSWDRTIKLWSADCATEPLKPRPSKKKRKAESGERAQCLWLAVTLALVAAEEWTETECLQTLTGHADAVTALTWIDRLHQ